MRIALGSALLSALIGSALLLPRPSRDDVLLDFETNIWLSLFIGVGWVSVAALISGKSNQHFMKAPLQAVGRTALTNYILQTLICTSLFYGHGLGLFERLDRAALMGIVLMIWFFELAASSLWLKHFRYGPVEWLQRYIAYLRKPCAYVSTHMSAAV